jgi:hypothetical protein
VKDKDKKQADNSSNGDECAHGLVWWFKRLPAVLQIPERFPSIQTHQSGAVFLLRSANPYFILIQIKVFSPASFHS